MAGKATSNTTPAASLTQADRVLLDLLRDGIAERSAIRNARIEGRARTPEDTKRARLERSQERLEALFDEAVARPEINRALRDAGLDIEEVRAKADRAAWRDTVTAINAVRSPAERQADDQRREAVAEATRAIVEAHRSGVDDIKAAWVDVLERQVRASLSEQDRGEAAVAKRLVAWTEAALNLVPGPVAASARHALVEHAYGEMGDSEGRAMRRALQEVLAEDKTGRYVRPSDDRSGVPHERASERPPNRIWVDDTDPAPHGERQVQDFVDAAGPVEAPTDAGLLSRIRGYLGNRRTEAAPGQEGSGDEDGIPDSLKRRYAIHVSDDRRTIELFEAGAKAPAITLDAKSISTPHDEGAVIADIVLLARDRGWQSLKVTGTAEFKDAVWLEARKAGIVAQHEPSSAVKAALEKWERERPANRVQQAPAPPAEKGPRDDLARAFAGKSPEERLADPRLRNAQLVLAVGIRTAEKELGRPVAEMPDVAKALTAAVREQLATGKVFDAPFVKPSPLAPMQRAASAPKIEADRISPARQ